MRKALIAFMAVLAIACTGCCSNLSREGAYHDGVKQLVIESGLLDEYEAYLEADTSIKAGTKKIRKDTPVELRLLIAEEEKALKKKD